MFEQFFTTKGVCLVH